jgi:2-polyprenyl-3-methyl-5-hydroxy-6-metoxy-1,4-benzoquinol methylase
MVPKVETDYKGLAIKAGSNLHQECISIIKNLGLRDRALVLDLGAGEGAFSRRLLDSGYKVTAVEREIGRYRCDATCYNLNLNADFCNQWSNRFDLVVAIEVIEHLQNPRHFIYQCLQSLKDGGYLLITSPNMESWVSRISYLRDGRFLWFEEEDYESLGHITPVFTWQMRQICREFKTELVEIEHTKNLYLREKVRRKTSLMGILYPLMKGYKQGEINIFVIRNNPVTTAKISAC